MRYDRPGLSILGVKTGRHSKISKDLLSYSTISGFYVSSFCHFGVGEVTRSPFIIIHNIKEEVSVREKLSGKVIRKLYNIVPVEEKYVMGRT